MGFFEKYLGSSAEDPESEIENPETDVEDGEVGEDELRAQVEELAADVLETRGTPEEEELVGELVEEGTAIENVLGKKNPHGAVHRGMRTAMAALSFVTLLGATQARGFEMPEETSDRPNATIVLTRAEYEALRAQVEAQDPTSSREDRRESRQQDRAERRAERTAERAAEREARKSSRGGGRGRRGELPGIFEDIAQIAEAGIDIYTGATRRAGRAQRQIERNQRVWERITEGRRR